MVLLILIVSMYNGLQMNTVMVPSYGDLRQNIERCHAMGRQFVRKDDIHRTYQCLDGGKE